MLTWDSERLVRCPSATRQHIAFGFGGHVAQPCMGGTVPLVVAHGPQLGVQLAEVVGFLGSHLEPVQVIGFGPAGQAPDGVQGRVDGV